MTAKQKAIELVDAFKDSYISTVPVTNFEAKEMAIISINETIRMLSKIGVKRNVDWLREVKSEIEQL